MATTNYNWTEIDPTAKINIAGDVNAALSEIDTSLKAVADTIPAEAAEINAKNGTETGSLILNNMLNGATGQYSTAEGSGTTASAFGAHAEGYQSKATQLAAHAEGKATAANGEQSHAEGANTTASGSGSHAEGNYSTASGAYSHAEGSSSATAAYSHAEGSGCTASVQGAHAEGIGTIANAEGAHAGGKYNISDTTAKYLEIIGNGTGSTDSQRSNARTLSTNGTGWYQTDIKCGGTDDSAATYSLAEIGAIVATMPAIDFGASNSLQVSANSSITADITFNSTKSDVPNVYCQVHSSVRVSCAVEQVTNSQASIKLYNDTNSDADAVIIDWLAVSGR